MIRLFKKNSIWVEMNIKLHRTLIFLVSPFWPSISAKGSWSHHWLSCPGISFAAWLTQGTVLVFPNVFSWTSRKCFHTPAWIYDSPKFCYGALTWTSRLAFLSGLTVWILWPFIHVRLSDLCQIPFVTSHKTLTTSWSVTDKVGLWSLSKWTKITG